MSKRAVLTLAALVVLLGGAIALRMLVGGENGRLEWPTSPEFTEIRGQRVLAAVIVGAALAVGGVMLQCLLRNHLASPDLLGLASGSGLGVVLAAYFAYKAGMGVTGSASIPAALAGALGALAVVYALSQKRG